MAKKKAAQVKKILTDSGEELSMVPVKFLGTGTLLTDLACTGKPDGGIPTGSVVLMVGDSNSGKTFIGLAMLAEASRDPFFDDYDIILDTPEGGARMEITDFFGSKLKSRMKAPAYFENGDPAFSTTLEEFYDTLKHLNQERRKYIYMLDSENVLSCEAELKKAKLNTSARESGQDTKGEIEAKARVNSQNLRQIIPFLKRTESILIIISQTRDDIKARKTFFSSATDSKTRSGGNALTFYADIEIWLSIYQRLKKKINDVYREYGIISRIKVKRTRVSGKAREVYIPILSDFGIDDMGACVDFLIDEKYWDATTARGNPNEILSVEAPEFEFTGKREALINLIEDMDAEEELFHLVIKVWNEIEEKLRVKRKARYD